MTPEIVKTAETSTSLLAGPTGGMFALVVALLVVSGVVVGLWRAYGKERDGRLAELTKHYEALAALQEKSNAALTALTMAFQSLERAIYGRPNVPPQA
jgi:hypothetical protein